MAPRKRHHVVSRGYQRFFADGERIVLCSKAQRSGIRRIREVGTADNFVRKNFSSYRHGDVWVDDLEDQWQRLENAVLPSVRAWVFGDEVEDSRNSVKVLAALHFARGYAAEALFNRIHRQVFDEKETEMLEDATVRVRWAEEFGTELTYPAFHDVFSRSMNRLGPGSSYRAERLAHFYNKTIDWLIPIEVQAITVMPGRRAAGPRPVGLVLGDNPLVHFDEHAVQMGVLGGLALNDASHVYMPLAPHLAVMFNTTGEPDANIDSAAVQMLNRWTWRAAIGYVAWHPAMDGERSLAMRLD